jgi:hypothetical protein
LQGIKPSTINCQKSNIRKQADYYTMKRKLKKDE